MEKTFKLISAIAIIAAMCLPACNKVELTEDPINEEPGTEVTPTRGWTVAISATIGGDPSTKALAEDPDSHNLIATFETTDSIFVYNKTKGTWDANTLSPDVDGASASLNGTLTGEYAEGDQLLLCYGISSGNRFVWDNAYCNSLTDVVDCALATVSITATEASTKTLTTSSATFENQNSIFKLNFTTGGSAVPVKKFRFHTENGKLVTALYPNSGYAENGYINASLKGADPEPTTEPVYVAFRNESSEADTYIFEVFDGSDIYVGTKGGLLSMGKYYTLSTPISTTLVPKPTVTYAGSPISPSDWYQYSISDTQTLEISGSGERYYFSTAKFSPTAAWPIRLTNTMLNGGGGSMSVIQVNSGDASITLSGDSTIEADASTAAISTNARSFSGYNWKGSVVFQGNGTLTITAATTNPNPGYQEYSRGILIGRTEGTVTAASGYTLTVSDGVDNGDGTTTWVYTVRPAITATAANISEAVAEFNASPASDVVLLITENISSSFTITRADGTIDLGGNTISSDIFIQNNVAGEVLTIRNGTISGGIDGKGGQYDYYAGTVILEDLIVTSTIWNDGHAYIINSGTYNQIELKKNASTPGTMTINGGFFGDIYRYVDRYGGGDDGCAYILYGGKYKNKNSTNKLDDWCASGYSVKSNTDGDSATYPFVVSAD